MTREEMFALIIGALEKEKFSLEEGIEVLASCLLCGSTGIVEEMEEEFIIGDDNYEIVIRKIAKQTH